MGPNQNRIPAVIITKLDDRSWVGGLYQGEGSTQTHYVKKNDSTALVLDVEMTDQTPVFRFSDLVGLPRPKKPKLHGNSAYLPSWRREVYGLRALRVVGEILPYLTGEKLREAQRAMEFFAPAGMCHGGWFSALHVWPPEEFPLRKRRAPLHTSNTDVFHEA